MREPTSHGGEAALPRPQPRARRRVERPATGGRVHEVGDVELGSGRDDDDVGWGVSAGGGGPADAAERWLREQRPPHWG